VSDRPATDGIDIRAALGVADGSLSGEQRARAVAGLQATAAGRSALEQQELVVRALRAGGPVPSPALRGTVAAQSGAPAAGPRVGGPATSPAASGSARLRGVAHALLRGLRFRPSIAAALELGRRPATEPAPPLLIARPALLARAIDGVAFPNWARADVTPSPPLTWTPTGARGDRLNGRQADTVFYTDGQQRIAYTIIAGDPLDPPPDARQITVAGRRLWLVRDGRRDLVVFTRQGHTCLLAGDVMSRRTLERLATVHGDGRIDH
jgi:hypothetical protein